jgi:hypothetical protein
MGTKLDGAALAAFGVLLIAGGVRRAILLRAVIAVVLAKNSLGHACRGRI